jgi:hypothetical protein
MFPVHHVMCPPTLLKCAAVHHVVCAPPLTCDRCTMCCAPRHCPLPLLTCAPVHCALCPCLADQAHKKDGGEQYARDQAAAEAAETEAAAEEAENKKRAAAGKTATKPKTGLVDAVGFVIRTPEVLCLAGAYTRPLFSST